jgi:hypothetical protein
VAKAILTASSISLIPSRISQQSKGMLEHEANCSDLQYELDKAACEVLRGFTGLSPPELNQSFQDGISKILPDLGRRLRLSVDEPNEVTCKVKFGATEDGGHQGTIILQNKDEVSDTSPCGSGRLIQQDPRGERLTEVTLEVFPSEHGWDSAVKVAAARQNIIFDMEADDEEAAAW